MVNAWRLLPVLFHVGLYQCLVVGGECLDLVSPANQHAVLALVEYRKPRISAFIEGAKCGLQRV